MENIVYHCYKTSYLNEEVNGTEPSPSFSVPWFHIQSLFGQIIHKKLLFSGNQQNLKGLCYFAFKYHYNT